MNEEIRNELPSGGEDSGRRRRRMSQTQKEMMERRRDADLEAELREEALNRSFAAGPSRIPEKARMMNAAPYGDGGSAPVASGQSRAGMMNRGAGRGNPGEAPKRYARREADEAPRRPAREPEDEIRVGYEPGRMGLKERNREEAPGDTMTIPAADDGYDGDETTAVPVSSMAAFGRGDTLPPRSGDNRKALEYLESRRPVGWGGRGGGRPPRGGKPMIIAVILILLAALVAGGALLLPGSNPIKNILSGIGSGKTQASPELVKSFELDPGQERILAPNPVYMTARTSTEVTDIRIIGGDGHELPAEKQLTENSGENLWNITWTPQDAYDGPVYLEVRQGDRWRSTNAAADVSVTGAVPPRDSDGQETAAPAQTETPAGPGQLVEESETPAPETPEPAGEPADEGDGTGEPADGEPYEGYDPENPDGDEGIDPSDIESASDADAAVRGSEDSTGDGRMVIPEVSPTPKPTATPTPEPRIELGPAAAEADPGIITNTVIYSNGRKEKNYSRPAKELMHMPLGNAYAFKEGIGVLTFRGNAFRTNAAVGTVDGAIGLRQEWQAEAGKLYGANQTYWGIGFPGQPAIVKWSREVREASNIYEAKQGKSALKEVIVAGLDGAVHFLDLDTGELTRNSIKLYYPMRGTPSLHPMGAPYMTVGQFARKMKAKTGRIGLRQYNLYSCKELTLINGLETKKYKAPNDTGSFETSALIDRTSGTMVTAGSNGLLYLISLDYNFDYEAGVYTQKMSTTVFSAQAKSQRKKEKLMAVESSPAVYDRYVFYADMGGVLRCVDTNTLTVVWALETGDAVEAAVALDLSGPETLDLYTANELSLRKKGNAAIRRIDARTGETLWTREIGVVKPKKGNSVIGFRASPVIGENGLKDLVYFTVTGLSDEGREQLGVGGEDIAALIALNKADGNVVWAAGLADVTYSSPVAVYSPSGEGWIIQCSGGGDILLLNGLSGKEITRLHVEGEIEASPAVYHNMMVIGTTGKEASYIYGIRILAGTDKDRPYQAPSEDGTPTPPPAQDSGEGAEGEAAGNEAAGGEEDLAEPEIPEDEMPEDGDWDEEDGGEAGGYDGSTDVE